MLGKNLSLIFGPPGTGKTTTLVEIFSKHLLAGTPMDRMAYVSFTKRAATEAKERVAKKHGINPASLRWFRTLHSLAYQFLGIQRTEVMGPKDYARISLMMGQPLSIPGVPHAIADGATYGDKILFYESQARVKGLTLTQLWKSLPTHEAIALADMLHAEYVLMRYKKNTRKLDFIDLINRFVEVGKASAFDVVIVDEAQDLSPRQWDMVEIICKGCKNVYVAGDDDQAIFQWAGADAAQMLRLRGWGEEHILPVSYRVPPAIKGVADQIIARVTGARAQKVWSANPHTIGRLVKVPVWHNLDCSSGSWLFLARSQYMLEDIVWWCQNQGYLYESAVEFGPVRNETIRAFLAWRKLLAGGTVFADQALALYDSLRRGVGYTHGHKARVQRQPADTLFTLKDLQKNYGLMLKAGDPMELVLGRATPTEIAFFRSSKNNDPIRISTIHAVKGAEADHVVLLTDMSAATYQGFQVNPDPEHRLWYVAVTRAKQTLIVVEAKNHLLRYEIPV